MAKDGNLTGKIQSDVAKQKIANDTFEDRSHLTPENQSIFSSRDEEVVYANDSSNKRQHQVNPEDAQRRPPHWKFQEGLMGGLKSRRRGETKIMQILQKEDAQAKPLLPKASDSSDGTLTLMQAEAKDALYWTFWSQTK